MNMPPRMRAMSDGIEKPKKLSEYPAYVCKKIRGFFSRLFYIFSLVWQSAPFILIVMMLLCLFEGLLPVVGAYISRDLLNEIQALIEAKGLGPIESDAFETMLFLFILNLVYLFLKKVLGKISQMVTAVAGELVVNHIKLMIIGKAKGLDARSFDDPEFYERLENANREANMRPIGILNATFSLISAAISAVSFVVVLSYLSPLAPIVVIVAALPGAIVSLIYRNKNFRYIRFHSKERRQMQYYSSLMVNKDRVQEIKILGLADTFTDKYKSAFSKYYKGLKGLIVKEGVSQIIVSLLTTAANCALFVYVAYTVIFGDKTIGDYSLYSGALTSITTYVATLLTSTVTIYEGTLFIDNMIRFMKEERKIVSISEQPLIPERGVAHRIEFKNVSKAYGDKLLYENLNFVLPPAGIVGVIGPNGAGKTTLFRLIMGLDTPDTGEITLGETVKIAYVDQQHKSIDPEKTVYETIAENSEFVRLGKREVNARAYVSRFNFSGADQEKLCGILSGGERNRLHLALTLKDEGNVLLLDEPTNDVDVNTIRALEEGLENFAGCAVVISHDRWFLDRIATHILAFEGDSQVYFFEGTYSEYEENKKRRLGNEEPKRFKYKKLMEE